MLDVDGMLEVSVLTFARRIDGAPVEVDDDSVGSVIVCAEATTTSTTVTSRMRKRKQKGVYACTCTFVQKRCEEEEEEEGGVKKIAVCFG